MTAAVPSAIPRAPCGSGLRGRSGIGRAPSGSVGWGRAPASPANIHLTGLLVGPFGKITVWAIAQAAGPPDSVPKAARPLGREFPWVIGLEERHGIGVHVPVG